jgi:hypothetical protein
MGIVHGQVLFSVAIAATVFCGRPETATAAWGLLLAIQIAPVWIVCSRIYKPKSNSTMDWVSWV